MRVMIPIGAAGHWMAFLRRNPALKRTTFIGGTRMARPVLGFMAFHAFRLRTRNLPKPPSVTRPCPLSISVRHSRKARMVFAISWRDTPVWSATARTMFVFDMSEGRAPNARGCCAGLGYRAGHGRATLVMSNESTPWTRGEISLCDSAYPTWRRTEGEAKGSNDRKNKKSANALHSLALFTSANSGRD